MNRREFVASITVGKSVLITGCSEAETSATQTQNPTVTESSSPSESPTPTRTPLTEFSLSSEDLSDGDATHKLAIRYKARTQQSANPEGMNGGHRSGEDEKLIVVRMDVENIGESEIDLVSSIFGLEVASSGENISFNLPIGEQQIGNLLLQPNESQNGWLLASIPSDITEATVVVEQNQYYRANYDSSLHVSFKKDDSLDIGMDTL